EVSAFLSEQRCLCEQRQHILTAQSDVAKLRPRAAIRVGGRKRVFAQSKHDQRRKAAIWRADQAPGAGSAACALRRCKEAPPQPMVAAARPALALPSSSARRETGCPLAQSGFGGSTM